MDVIDQLVCDPHLGPLPKNRMSFAILVRLTATVFSAPEVSTTASLAA